MFQGWRSKSALVTSSLNRSRTRRSCLMGSWRAGWTKPLRDDEEEAKKSPARRQSREKRYLPISPLSRWVHDICGKKISSVIAANMPCIRIAKTTNEKKAEVIPAASESHPWTVRPKMPVRLARKNRIHQRTSNQAPVASECYPQGYATASWLSQTLYSKYQLGLTPVIDKRSMFRAVRHWAERQKTRAQMDDEECGISLQKSVRQA